MGDGHIKNNQNTTKLLNYLKNSSKQYPCLDKEQEQMMINRYRDDRETLNKLLFMHNIRMVFNQAKKYVSKSGDFDNLVQDGMLGLAEAAKRFDLDRGTKFCTYAVAWVRKYILANFYGKQVEIDKRSSSLNSPSIASTKKNHDDTVVDLESYVNEYIDPTYCSIVKPIDSDLASLEQTELCAKLYQTMENDTSLSATDKAVFIDLFKNREKTREVAEKYDLEMKDASEIRHRILGKFKDILTTEYKIQEYSDVG